MMINASIYIQAVYHMAWFMCQFNLVFFKPICNSNFYYDCCKHVGFLYNIRLQVMTSCLNSWMYCEGFTLLVVYNLLVLGG
jgi:hypothetical protein